MATIKGICYNSSGNVATNYEFICHYAIGNTNEVTQQTWIHPMYFTLQFVADQDNTFTGDVSVTGTIKDSTGTNIKTINETVSVNTDHNALVTVYDLGGAGFTIKHNSSGVGSFTVDLTIQYTGSASSSFGKGIINKTISISSFPKYTIGISNDNYTIGYINGETSSVSGVYGSTYTFKATSISHNATYLYFLNSFILPNGSSISIPSNSTSYSISSAIDGAGTFKVTGKRVNANPGSISSSPSITGPTSISLTINGYSSSSFNTSYINNTYYIAVSTSSLSTTTTSLSYKTTTSISTFSKSVTINNLTGGTTYNYGIYCYNSYNKYYYRVSSGSFTTDASSYNITALASNIGAKTAIITITSGPNPTTNLNSYWYISTSTDNGIYSLDEVSFDLRTTSINLNNLDSQATITRNIYVYSTASKKYYKAGSITFETTVPQYDASLIVTGITESEADITLFGLSDTTNLDGKYYLSETNRGLSTNSLSIYSSENRGTTIRVSNLIPGYKYNFYCYLYNTYDAKYYYVSSVEFVTYSTIVYIINKDNKLQKCRLYEYDPLINKPRGLILKVNPLTVPKTFITSDGEVFLTSDNQIFNTTELFGV